MFCSSFVTGGSIVNRTIVEAEETWPSCCPISNRASWFSTGGCSSGPPCFSISVYSLTSLCKRHKTVETAAAAADPAPTLPFTQTMSICRPASRSSTTTTRRRRRPETRPQMLCSLRCRLSSRPKWKRRPVPRPAEVAEEMRCRPVRWRRRRKLLGRLISGSTARTANGISVTRSAALTGSWTTTFRQRARTGATSRSRTRRTGTLRFWTTSCRWPGAGTARCRWPFTLQEATTSRPSVAWPICASVRDPTSDRGSPSISSSTSDISLPSCANCTRNKGRPPHGRPSPPLPAHPPQLPTSRTPPNELSWYIILLFHLSIVYQSLSQWRLCDGGAKQRTTSCGLAETGDASERDGLRKQ